MQRTRQVVRLQYWVYVLNLQFIVKKLWRTVTTLHVSSIDPRRAENRTSVEQLLEKMTKKERNRRRLFTAPKRAGVLK